AFIAALQLTARYPAYLSHPDEPLAPGADTIAIPEGTTILTSGAASVPLAAAAWHHGSRRASLSVSGTGFMGRVEPTVSGARGLGAEAWDNAPVPHVGRSAEIALRLPSLEELRAATRAATRDVATAADSIAEAQRDLGTRTGDLAQQRSRDAAGSRRPGDAGRDATLPFQATE